MPIRRSPNDARHPRPQGGRDHPEQVVAINRNDWSQSIGTPGRDHPVRAHHRELHRNGDEAAWWQANKIDPIPLALRLWHERQFDHTGL